MSIFNTSTDAKNFVINSGVIDWDFASKYSNSVIVSELLPRFIYQNDSDYLVYNELDEPEFDFDAALKTFISTELGQNPAAYNL